MALDNMLAWFAGFEFSSLFGYLIAVFFCWVLGYQVWCAYFRGRGKKTVLQPLDAMEAERAAEAERVQATQTQPTQAEPKLNQEPQLSQQPHQEAEAAHESHETQEPRLSAVPVQLDLIGFSTKHKWSSFEYKQHQTFAQLSGLSLFKYIN